MNTGTPSAPSKPQTSVDRIKRINNTFSTVSITWDIPDTNNAHISSYFVIVFPYIIIPANGIISMSNPLFMERELTLLLQNEQQYNIQVRANSCEDMVEGETSAALTITVKGWFYASILDSNNILYYYSASISQNLYSSTSL